MRAKVAVAFLSVYLIWGSTYLAIGIVEQSLPPFFMAGTRFIIAGLILYAVMRFKSTSHETTSHWGKAFLIGGLMLMGGHGAVVWVEQWLPSGLTSLLISTVPLWIVFTDWIRGGSKPNLKVAGGLFFGFAGVALLAGGLENLGASQVDLIGGITLVCGAFLWAQGSLVSRSTRFPFPPLLATSMQMIAGGALLLVASVVAGEWTRIRLDQVSFNSTIAWLYLIVFGSLVGFTSYIWLLKETTASRVSTYAYVNPIIAMFLGWAIAGEPITLRNVAAASIIVMSVVIITTFGAKTATNKNEKKVSQQCCYAGGNSLKHAILQNRR